MSSGYESERNLSFTRHPGINQSILKPHFEALSVSKHFHPSAKRPQAVREKRGACLSHLPKLEALHSVVPIFVSVRDGKSRVLDMCLLVFAEGETLSLVFFLVDFSQTSCHRRKPLTLY